jgi:hypothetical protein
MRVFRSSVLFMLMLMISLVSGCQKYQRDIYDKDNKIAEQGDSYTFITRIGSTANDKMNAKFSGFYGMDSTWTIDASGEEIATMEVNAEVSKGRFKVVLISPDNKVHTVFEGSKNETIDLRLSKGISRIKIVGDEAKGNIEMSIKGNDKVKISKAK